MILCIYKESSGNFPPPANLTAESGDEEAMLAWQDMNLSGTFDYDFTNGLPTNSIIMNGESTSYAGEKYDIAGESTVESMQVFNMATGPVTVTIAGLVSKVLYTAQILYIQWKLNYLQAMIGILLIYQVWDGHLITGLF